MKHAQPIAYVVTMLAIGCASSAPVMTPASGSRPAPAASNAASPDVAPSTVDLQPAPASEPAGPGVALCDVVCEQAFVEPVSDSDGAEDFARAHRNANQVLEGLKPKLLACFERRVRAKPQTEPFMTLSIVVGPDGKVVDVKTTDAPSVSPRAIRCLSEQARTVTFEPPRGRGTMRVDVPFTLRKAADAE
jgi:hypothetical protein